MVVLPEIKLLPASVSSAILCNVSLLHTIFDVVNHCFRFTKNQLHSLTVLRTGLIETI